MATFHLFPRLPAELRAQIWEMTVEPRIVEVRFRVTSKSGQTSRWLILSSTPVPAPLQTCRESRNAGLYQRCFSDLPIRCGAAEDSERRYVWLNLDIDMVSIGDSWFHVFRPVAQMIKRLRFSRDNNDENWCNLGEAEELCHYKNVSEIHVVVSENGDMEDWHGASQRYTWHCGVENVLIIDDKEGQKIKLIDLEHKCDRLLEAESREQGTDFLYCNRDITNWPGNLDNLRANS